jgi:hypothetical protein
MYVYTYIYIYIYIKREKTIKIVGLLEGLRRKQERERKSE